MAVSIDKVYQTVLALANKEQRGYITPQEFNLFADHAQMDIFKQYFYDLNQSSRTPGNDTVYGNPTKIIEEKTAIPLCLWDERLSTSGAYSLSSDLDIKFSQKKKKIDEKAATFILQGAIDYLNN